MKYASTSSWKYTVGSFPQSQFTGFLSAASLFSLCVSRMMIILMTARAIKFSKVKATTVATAGLGLSDKR